MATRGVEPITLPWKRPEKGVSAAELGASFRVEQREDGWHCTVRVGRRAEVLATGLRRLRDAQCRAEAHAATLPEVAAALAKLKAEAAKEPRDTPVRAAGVVRAGKGSAVPDVRDDRPGPATPHRAAAPTFEPISDGCICGKIEGGTWIADPAGKVSVPAGTAPEVAQEICRVAAQHYAALRSKTAATLEPRAAGKAASRTVAKRKPVVEVVAPEAAPATPRRAGKGKRGKGTNRAARKRLAAKLAGKPMAKASTKARATRGAKVAVENAAKTTATVKTTTAKTTAKSTAKATTAKAARTARTTTAAKSTAKATTAKAAKTARTTTAAKSTARIAKTTAAKVTAKATAQTEGTAKTTAKRSGRSRDAGKKASRAAQAETVEEPMAKNSGKASKGACGCVTWAEVEGKARGETKHGAFVIEPEGKKHALYFYDLEGQSRHLQSGEAGKLRKVAEEMAARGQPAMKPTSAGDDGALLKMFMAGAMEEET